MLGAALGRLSQPFPAVNAPERQAGGGAHPSHPRESRRELREGPGPALSHPALVSRLFFDLGLDEEL